MVQPPIVDDRDDAAPVGSQHPGRNVGVPVGEGAIWLPITRGPAPGRGTLRPQLPKPLWSLDLRAASSRLVCVRFARDLYGAFSVKRLFWVCCQFFVRSGKAVLRSLIAPQVARGFFPLEAVSSPWPVDRRAKRIPLWRWGRLAPVANRRAPRASRSALTSDGAARAGGCLFAHRGKPGWHSAAVFE